MKKKTKHEFKFSHGARYSDQLSNVTFIGGGRTAGSRSRLNGRISPVAAWTMAKRTNRNPENDNDGRIMVKQRF
jgi:hypothetical protein